MRESKVAVFIDTENLPVRCVSEIIDISSGYGRLVERRAYGDFTREAVHPWIEVAGKYALSLQTAVSSQSGKNGSDILLAIDAMEYLGSSAIDLFCIASSDRDVGHLATRIRMRGKRAIGMGAHTASKLLRESFDEFFELVVAEQTKAAAVSSNVVALKQKADIRPYVVQALQSAALKKDGWLDVAALGSLLRKIDPQFAPSQFGSSKLSTVLKGCDFLQTQMHGKNRMQIRMKQGS